MTLSPAKPEKTRDFRLTHALFGWFVLFLLLLILRNTALAAASMRDGLKLCAHTVIPSLFPFMVLSELILSGGIADGFLGLLTRPLQRLFRLPAAGCTAFLFGVLCGFPVGAKCAVSALSQGQLNRRECEDIIAAASIPSPAFLIGAVGGTLWQDPAFGLLLWGLSLALALLTAILLGARRKNTHSEPLLDENTTPRARVPLPRLLSASVRSATESVLLVCAYVIFFATLTGVLRPLTATLSASPWLHATLTAAAELSSGMRDISALPDKALGRILSAVAVGWSGLSVHCQTLSLCDGHGLSFKSYFGIKASQALLLGLMLSLILLFRAGL